MNRFVLLGAPGSGKGTIAERITIIYGIPQISTGDLFRKEIAGKTPFGMEIEKYVSAGELVPDEMVVNVVVEHLEAEYSQEGFMLDGFPRTLNQADSLLTHLAENGTGIDKVFYLSVPREEILKRLAGRRVCQDCNRTYNVNSFPSKIEGICDDCGGVVIQRDDDKEETVIERLDVYDERTKPLINYYAEKGLLIQFDGMRKPEELVAEIGALIEEK